VKSHGDMQWLLAPGRSHALQSMLCTLLWPRVSAESLAGSQASMLFEGW